MEDSYVYCIYDPTDGRVFLRVVSAERKRAIDRFAQWCLVPFTEREQEKRMGLQWCRQNVDKSLPDSCQWAVVMGKNGMRMVIETLYDTRLIKGSFIGGERCHWYDVKHAKHYEVVSRSWTAPGTAGQKYMGVAYELLSMEKDVYIVCIAYQDYEARKKLKLYTPFNQAQQKILDVMKTHGVRFVSIRDYLRKLNYWLPDTSNVIFKTLS